jgi:hypothetical protein
MLSRKLNKMEFKNIFKPLVSSHFLTTEELGRLLFLVNKNLTNSYSVNAWLLLCQHHWGYHTANTLLMTTDLDAETYFQTFATLRSNIRSWELLSSNHNPRFSFKDYVLLVEARTDETNAPLFCHAIAGESIPDLFTKGEILQKFVNPITPYVTTTQYPFSSFEEYSNSKVKLTLPTWNGYVHLIRCDGVAIRLLSCSHNGRCAHHQQAVPKELYPLFSQSSFMISDKGGYYIKHCLCDGFPRRRKMFRRLNIDDNYMEDAGWTGNLNVQLRLVYQPIFNASKTVISLIGFHLNIIWRVHGKNCHLTSRGLSHILECLSEWDDDIITLSRPKKTRTNTPLSMSTQS